RVAVDQPPGPVDRRVDDLGVGHVGPLGAGQVDVRYALHREPLLLRAASPPLPVQFALVEIVELAVVVTEAHAQLRGANSGPGPWMTRNQNVNAIAAIAT